MQELCKAVVCLGDAFICMLMSVLLTMAFSWIFDGRSFGTFRIH